MVSDTLMHADFSDNPLVTGEPGFRFYAGCPVEYEGTALGALCILDTEPRKLEPADIELLKSLAAWVEDELKVTALSEAHTQLLARLEESERREMIDAETGAWNHRGMDVLLQREFSRAKRANLPMSLLHVALA